MSPTTIETSGLQVTVPSRAEDNNFLNKYNEEHDVLFLARESKSIIGISYQSKTEGMKYENPSKKEKGIHVLFLIEISGKLLPIIRCKRQTFGYGTQ